MIYVSTNMYRPGTFPKVMKILEAVEDVGIELFVMFHDPVFEKELQKHLEEFKGIPFTFHGPYYGTEHSAPEGTEVYKRSMDYFTKMLEYEEILKPAHIVFHFNNCKIKDRDNMIFHSCRNLETLRAMTKTPLLLENTGVAQSSNVLFNQEEFINIVKEEPEEALIDIGHAYANGWDLEKVMSSLKEEIRAYHLHTNDGVHDSHNRIFEKGPDMVEFVKLYKKFTPTGDLVIEYSPLYEDREGEVIEDIKRLKELLSHS